MGPEFKVHLPKELQLLGSGVPTMTGPVSFLGQFHWVSDLWQGPSGSFLVCSLGLFLDALPCRVGFGCLLSSWSGVWMHLCPHWGFDCVCSLAGWPVSPVNRWPALFFYARRSLS
jgi:hypothetical protein